MKKERKITEQIPIESYKQKCIACFLLMCLFCIPVILLTMFYFQTIGEQKNDAIFAMIFFIICISASYLYAHFSKLFEDNNKKYLLIFALFLLIGARLLLFNHESGDYNNYLLKWLREMRELEGIKALTTPIGNYNIPYLYLLFLCTKLPIYDLFIIKSFSVIFDLILAFTVVTILKSQKISEYKCFFAFCLALIAPTILLNSGYWGQCDSVYCALSLIAVYRCSNEKSISGCIFFGLAFAFKLQAIFVFPIIAFFIAYRKIKPVHISWLIGSFVGVCLPVLFMGRSIKDTFSVYITQADYYSSINMNSPSFWAVISTGRSELFMAAALCIAAIVVIIFTFVVLLLRPLKSKADFYELAFLYSMIVPFILPKMHERYFMLAEAMSIIYLFLFPKRWKVSFCVLLIGFISYSYYLFSDIAWVSSNWLAVGYFLVIVYAIKKFFSSSLSDENVETPIKISL